LWQAPESLTQTYTPDLTGLQVQPIPEGVRLSLPADPHIGIAKALELHLSPDRPVVTLEHELRNESFSPVELPPWAITQLRLSGVVLLPLPAGPVDSGGLLPNRQLTFWPYTSFHDSRLRLEDEAVLLVGESRLPPVKVGYRNPDGWLTGWRGFSSSNASSWKPVRPTPISAAMPRPTATINLSSWSRSDHSGASNQEVPSSTPKPRSCF